MFGRKVQSWFQKAVFVPQPVGVNAWGSLNQIFQIALINKYVSKFSLDPFSDLRD